MTWVWRGTVEHNVTFLSGPSSPSQTDGSFSRTFDGYGDYDYLCTIHGPSTSGTIVVMSPWDYSPSGAQVSTLSPSGATASGRSSARLALAAASSFAHTPSRVPR